MARNRKHQSAAVRFGPALKAFMLCAFIGGSGVGYVWQKSQIAELGHQMKQREIRLAGLQEQNQKLNTQFATLRSPMKLRERLPELKLGLVPVQPSQVWRLPEPLTVTDDPTENSFAGRDSRTSLGP
ncbi:MAG: hypothetical protein IH623_30930 [Verrucomicrobia bacterium]|nr:hypothetical protein [Verrucomicrobiota bacterium]